MKIIFKQDENIYIEQININEYREIWDEWILNKSNPHLEKITFEQYMCPLKTFSNLIHIFNNNPYNHFVFGYFECLYQSYVCPLWIKNAIDPIKIEVE